jgi:hypothetical protein
MTTKSTKLASLGRAAAAITFTRNNNKTIQSRNSRQASTQGVTTQPSCVAVFKQPLFLAFTLALSILAFAATPALAAAPEEPETRTPKPLDATFATFKGVLNPNAAGEAGTYEFLYRQSSTECTGASRAPEPAGTMLVEQGQTVEAKVTGLAPHTEYTVCLLARNTGGAETLGPAVTFTTKPGFGLENLKAAAINEPTAAEKSHDQFGASLEPGHPEEGLGPADNQAGSHPYALVTSFLLNPAEEISHRAFAVPGRGVKGVVAQLPPGFVGNVNAIPKCSGNGFTQTKGGGGSNCPNDTAVGLATTRLALNPHTSEWIEVTDPVYNLEAPPGTPAEFGFKVEGSPIFLDTTVRTGGDYGLTVTDSNVPQTVQVEGSKVTIWGVPEESSHDKIRGDCLGTGEIFQEEIEEGAKVPNEEESRCEAPGVEPVLPFLTNPTSCGVPRTGGLSVDDYEEPGNFATEPGTHPGEKVHTQSVTLPPLTGCDKLDFSPSIAIQPDGEQGSTPTGLNVGIHVNQESTSDPNELGEADVKNTTVTLPAGVQISPAAADGLEACTGNPADPPGTPGNEIGFKRFEEFASEPGTSLPTFTPRLPGSLSATEAGESEPLKPGVNFCPDASKIATVKVKTPLLEEELEGSVYLAAPQNYSTLQGFPQENPFSSLLAMYLVAEAPARGVLLKLVGKVELGEPGVSNGLQPGQIRTTFENTPQAPINELKLEFYGTDRAPLTTPALCGTYYPETSFTPWSATPAVNPTSSFNISSGPGGAPCSEPLGFSPSLASGTTNINAGSFSNLDTTLSREDGQQSIQSVTLHYPAGLSGLLSGVELCPEAQANAGTCGPNSQIGETIVSVGLGNDPFTVTGGKVYITGPYEGAPFGLSIVNPAKAGPFNLQEGRPVIVRAKIEVNPLTAALTITTDASGEHAIPTIIDGIPLQIKHVYVNINRPGFTFNPTSCNPTKITGEIKSAEGSTSPVEDAFQVTNCAQLKFNPQISFSTSGKTSKADGADLITKITYPSSAPGTYANVGYVKVELPKALPSRLTTLQKACTLKQFELNPAACPNESKIGYAVVHTPLLPVPLEGPAIFVSHGGEAFPTLTMVLQGYGVTIDLIGNTFISKSGITSTTFKSVPDQPFSTFELVLPQGPFSALAANGNLCTQKLVLPNEFVPQSGGAPLKQNSPVTVTGCAPAIYVTKHSVKGKVATITVSVPAAGKLVASAKGLSKASATATGAKTVTVKLHLTKREVAFLKKHHAKRLRATIHLSFVPKKGAKLHTTTTVFIG